MSWIIVITVFVLPFLIAALLIKLKPRKIFILNEPEGLYIISYKWWGFSEYGETLVTAHHFYVNIESGETFKLKETDETKKLKPLITANIKNMQAGRGLVKAELNTKNQNVLHVIYKDVVVTIYFPKRLQFRTRLTCVGKTSSEIKWNLKV